MNETFSIITAVHNCLAMNQLFWKTLDENTATPFELILIDNHSTDGSEVFFQQLAQRETGPHRVVYVRNPTNQSYPASQIQGMALARYAHMGFLNNDIWMPKGWELPLLAALDANKYAVVSPCGPDAFPFQDAADASKRRWKHRTWLSFIWKLLTRATEGERLEKSLRWMYGDLDNFSAPLPKNSPRQFDGIKGDVIFFSKSLLEIEPNPWDPRIEAADWHLYLTMAQHHENNPEIPLPQVLTSSFVHHFGRYSARQTYEPFSRDGFLTVDEVWGKERLRHFWWGYRHPQSCS